MRKASTRDLFDQLTRAAMSIAANIAEGGEYESMRDRARFLDYAAASAAETEEHIDMARDINAISYEHSKDLTARVVSVRRMLKKFIKRVRERIPPPTFEPKRKARRNRS